MLVDPRKGSTIPLDPTAKLHLRSGILLEPLTKNIFGSYPVGVHYKNVDWPGSSGSHDKKHDRVYDPMVSHDINEVVNVC